MSLGTTWGGGAAMSLGTTWGGGAVMLLEIRRYTWGGGATMSMEIRRYHMGRRGSHVCGDKKVPHGEEGQPCR